MWIRLSRPGGVLQATLSGVDGLQLRPGLLQSLQPEPVGADVGGGGLACPKSAVADSESTRAGGPIRGGPPTASGGGIGDPPPGKPWSGSDPNARTERLCPNGGPGDSGSQPPSSRHAAAGPGSQAGATSLPSPAPGSLTPRHPLRNSRLNLPTNTCTGRKLLSRPAGREASTHPNQALQPPRNHTTLPNRAF